MAFRGGGRGKGDVRPFFVRSKQSFSAMRLRDEGLRITVPNVRPPEDGPGAQPGQLPSSAPPSQTSQAPSTQSQGQGVGAGTQLQPRSRGVPGFKTNAFKPVGSVGNLQPQAQSSNLPIAGIGQPPVKRPIGERLGPQHTQLSEVDLDCPWHQSRRKL